MHKDGSAISYVIGLAEVGLAHASRVGRKAAVLGELLGTGFPVPAGFAITVDAAHAPRGELAAQVEAAWRRLGGGLVAVRSSGVDEDLTGMSYAGQYESVLGVRGIDAVLDAVRACWASAATERVRAYRGDTAGTAMGVLVQVMVEADAAGVAFSVNPVTGDRTEVVVNAVAGLADRLVSGEVDADQWTVRGDQPAGEGRTLDVEGVRDVARLARRVAAHAGTPQDIEWARDAHGLWLLQARPITALPPTPVAPVPIGIVVPAGVSTRNRAMDRPWTPLERSVFLPVFSAAVRHIFAYTTGIRPIAHEIGGWIYITVDDDGRPPARVDDPAPLELIELWYGRWKRELAEDLAALSDGELAGLTDPELVQHLHRIVDLFGRLHDRYFRLTGAAIAIGARLGQLAGQLLGWTPEQAHRLRGGLTGEHMEATARLVQLAQFAADRPAVRAYLARPDARASGLATVDGDFAAAFADHIARLGHRTVGFDITEPTWAERPDVLLSLIRVQLDRPYDLGAEQAAVRDRAAAALDEARHGLAGADPADRDRFLAAAAAATRAAPVRDEKVFQAVVLWARLRYAALEIGRRLVDRGAAERAEDAFFLELPEALAALTGGGDQRDRVRHHRGRHAWALANPGPDTYGAKAAASPPDPQPPDPAATPGDGTLRGLAASPGRYLGPARVVRDITEFGKLRHGDVLVCPETTAQWSLLFPSLGALVTDCGTMLSHPAILAREYGVPAVVATGDATRTLRDDELVVVDGTTGVVERVVTAFATATVGATA